METFCGRGHLPGAGKDWDVKLEVDWEKKEVNVHIDEAAGGMNDWPGLAVGTFGSEEIVFRTKGIPSLFTHWWHFVRGGSGNLWGIVLGLPDVNGVWRTCTLDLTKIE